MIKAPIQRAILRAVCFDAYQPPPHAKYDASSSFATPPAASTRKSISWQELEQNKAHRSRKTIPRRPARVLLVVDATTGSNALNRRPANSRPAAGVTGIIVTKLDGSGKGGIVVAIQHELASPPLRRHRRTNRRASPIRSPNTLSTPSSTSPRSDKRHRRRPRIPKGFTLP